MPGRGLPMTWSVEIIVNITIQDFPLENVSNTLVERTDARHTSNQWT